LEFFHSLIPDLLVVFVGLLDLLKKVVEKYEILV